MAEAGGERQQDRGGQPRAGSEQAQRRKARGNAAEIPAVLGGHMEAQRAGRGLGEIVDGGVHHGNVEADREGAHGIGCDREPGHLEACGTKDGDDGQARKDGESGEGCASPLVQHVSHDKPADGACDGGQCHRAAVGRQALAKSEKKGDLPDQHEGRGKPAVEEIDKASGPRSSVRCDRVEGDPHVRRPEQGHHAEGLDEADKGKCGPCPHIHERPGPEEGGYDPDGRGQRLARANLAATAFAVALGGEEGVEG